MILLVDDEAPVRTALAQTLELADLAVRTAADVDAALSDLCPAFAGAIVSDVRMPGRSGFDLLAAVRDLDPEIPVILLTGHGDVPMAVRAVGEGAYDFLEKPCAPERLVDTARRALEKRRLVLENRALRASLLGTVRLIGESPAMKALRDRVDRIAATSADVLLLGETGTGKEVTARAIHALSSRRDGPFVAINCGALEADLAGSEIFGHEKGAFTGATERRAGRFEHADGGTLLLDEVESMPLPLQPKLLRVLQEREVERLGSNRPVPVDVRVIAATKSDLKALAEAGSFRADLHYRLDVARIVLPPLRSRKEDIGPLFRAFVADAAGRSGAAAPEPSAAEMADLLAHDWPGNVRELRNTAERFALGLGLGIGEEDFAPSPEGSLAERMATFEKAVLTENLRAHKGAIPEICAALNLPRKTLYDKLKRHGLVPEDFR